MNEKIFTTPYIKGMSVVVPQKKIVVEDLNFDKDNLKNIIKLSGIEEIRQSENNETTSDYCLSAAEILFQEIDFDKSKIDGIIFSTPSGDYVQPGSGYVVHERLGLPTDCMVVDLKQACSGWVYGIFQAFLLIESGWCKNILLCAGDTPTKFINHKDKSLRTISGDAGTAAIISAGEEKCESTFTFFNDGKGLKSLYIPAGGFRTPTKKGVTDVEETDDQGNIKTAENLHMNGLDVMCFALDSVKKTVASALNIMDWQKEDVDLFVFHQANKFMVNTLSKRLKLKQEKVPFNVGKYGNSGCATIPLALCVENDLRKLELNKIILSGFGGGFACVTAALNLEKTHFCKLREYAR